MSGHGSGEYRTEVGPRPRRVKRVVLRLTALGVGSAVMAFELAGARLLMPTFGIGIEVWAAVIAITLGVLAVGYWLGGRIADARPSATPLASVLLLGGSVILVIAWLGPQVPGLFADMSFAAGAWMAAAVILSLPLLLLGMVQPMLARLMIPDAAHSGRVVGSLLAAATLGSMIGTALTGLVLLPGIGVTRTLWLIAVATASLGIVVWIAGCRWRSAGCALIVIAAASGVTAWKPAPGPHTAGNVRLLERVDGLYSHLEVLEVHGRPALVCNGVFQAAMPPASVGPFPGMLIRARDYTELIPFFRPSSKTALLIGLGGGLHVQALSLYGIEVQAVEIEPAVAELAEKHFGLHADVTIADGRAFLARTNKRFDAVILDAFIGGTAPEHLYTVEAFRRIADLLGPEGVLVVHLVSRPRHPATRAVERTLQAVFEHTLGARSGFDDELQHLYLFASRAPLGLQSARCADLPHYGFSGQEIFETLPDDGILLTDDRTCLAMLSRELVAEHHRRSLVTRRQSW